MVNNKIITYISFAKKSGSLSLGFDAVKSDVLCKNAKLIILLNDASEKTKKEVQIIAEKYKVKSLILALESKDLLHIFGKKIVVISISNKDLSMAILNSYYSNLLEKKGDIYIDKT